MKTFRNKFVVLFIFLIMISIVGGFLIFNAASMQKSDGVIINLAGRQRMLSQKFNKEFLDELNNRQIIASVEQYAKLATNQIQAYRKYYTKNIVSKLAEDSSGIQASADYHNVKGAIPLPATFLREVSESLRETSKFRYDLVSKWNINKNSGLSNNFEQKAWDSMSRNSEIPYAELLPKGTGVEYRYATADLANVQACVSCHNTNPNSPKSDFKIGDLMGVLIVSAPVTQDPAIAEALLNLKSGESQLGEISDNTYEITGQLFEMTLKALRDGGSTFKNLKMTEPIIISAASSKQIISKLDVVESLWNDMRKAIENLQTKEFNSTPYLKLVQNIRNLNVEVLQEMHNAVTMYEADSLAKVKKLQIFIVVIVGIIILAVVFAGVITRDIAFRKQADERYRSMAETASDAIISADGDGNIISWNKGAQIIFGYQEEEVLGKPLTILMPKKYRAAHSKGLKQVTATGKLNLTGKIVELHGLRKNNSEFPLGLSLGSWKTGNKIFYSGIVRDITERKRAEDNLRKLSQAIEQSPVSIAITDVNGNMEYVNPQFTEITGYSPEEVIGQSSRILKSDKTPGKVHKELWNTIISGKEWKGEICNKKKNGEIFWEFMSVSPIKKENGEIAQFLAVKTDITARKQVEAELAKERQNLERTVAQRTKELRETLIEMEETNTRLEAASKAKSQFLSSMSHELRTPLNSIIGFSQLMETDQEEPPTDSQKENLDQIQTSSKHLLNLINDVLSLTKIETGQIDVSLESLSVKELFKDIFPSMEPMAEKFSVKLIDKITEGEDAYIMADHTRFKQVLINLISNAIKYNHPSGTVTVSLEKIRGSSVRVSVEDTGKGISRENIPKLFDPFNRLGAEGLNIEGTGIGLTITRRLVKMMGGEIGVNSEVNKGSTFYLDIQRGTKPDVEIKETGTSSEPDSKTISGEKTVLYIEDNPANLKLVKKILSRRSNIKMLSSPEAKTGIELAIKHKPDLILMDINLPGMDGYEALNELSALDEANKIPVIALSANAMEHDIKRGKKAGFVDYITKPINVNNFLESVDKVLAQG